MTWLSDIEERLKAATPEPWHTKKNESEINFYHKGECFLINHVAYSNDIEFIAHSREDIPRLLSALKIAMEALEFYKKQDELMVTCMQCGYVDQHVYDDGIKAREALEKINLIGTEGDVERTEGRDG